MIGKAWFETALNERPDHPFEIEWHPFQLNPDMPTHGMARAKYLEHKFGGKDKTAKAYAPIETAAQEIGIDINWAQIQHMPNTLNAHRVIHWAGLEGRQTAVVTALFKAYWEDARDIGANDVLCDVAGGAGLDPKVIGHLLESDADTKDILARDAHAREHGMTGVPAFIIANQSVVSGAQPTNTWIKIIDDIVAHLGGA